MWRDGARTSVSQGVAQHAEGVFHCDSSQRVQRVQKDNVLPQRMPFARDGWADLAVATVLDMFVSGIATRVPRSTCSPISFRSSSPESVRSRSLGLPKQASLPILKGNE
jgi:hypothetical protein